MDWAWSKTIGFWHIYFKLYVGHDSNRILGGLVKNAKTYLGILLMPSTKHALNAAKYIPLISLLLLSLISLKAHALLEKKSDSELARIFESKIIEEQLDPSLQCMSKSPDHLADFQNTNLDPDLNMSEIDFQDYLTQNNLKSDINFTNFRFNTNLCDINKKEYFSLQLYTGGLYARRINAALRDQDTDELERYKILIKHAQSALMKLKPYEGFVVRGAKIPKDLLTDHVKGARVRYSSFLSTSLSSSVARSFGSDTRYVIVSKSCRYINPLSRHQTEKEVLCLPGTVFQVFYRKDNDHGGIDILMEELPSKSDQL